MANHQLTDQLPLPPNITALSLNPAREPSPPPRVRACHWRKLARELRDMIYELAYARRADDPIWIKFKSDVDADKKYREYPRQFRHGISNLLVDHQWLNEANMALFKNAPVRFNRITDENIYYFDGAPANLNLDRMLGFTHLDTVHLNLCDLTKLAPLLHVHCHRLKHLRITVGMNGKEISCEFTAKHMPNWHSHKHDAGCFRENPWLQQVKLSKLSGLESVTLESVDFTSVNNYKPIGDALARTLERTREPVTVPLWRAPRPASLGPLLHLFEKKKAEAGSSSRAVMAATGRSARQQAAITAGPAGNGTEEHGHAAESEFDVTSLVSDDEYVSDFYEEDDNDSLFGDEDDDGDSSSSDYD